MNNLSRRNFMVGSAAVATLSGLVPILARADDKMSGYAGKTLTIGLFSGDISQLAASKANHPLVRHFAKLEGDEATAVGGLLLGAGAARPERPKALADTLTKLTNMDAGTDFDMLYVQSEIDGHEQLLEIQKSQVKAGGSGMDVTIATILVPFIESHLAMLNAARDSMPS